ncbi:hypothetical protein [Duganella sp. BJB475]|uniref:hypothetical protein n=1 Tax=Duganella sp. BJB475 TaxID=2233914 RepID=UPI0011C0F65C|nr:hypothetical protein [Duganella sp. BJB475]
MKVWRYWSKISPGGAEGMRLNSDICNGVEFRAALHFDTPLAVLQWHGYRHYDLNYCPPQFTDNSHQGHWSAKLKTLREMGIDMDDPGPGWQTFEMAIRNGYDLIYPEFLIALRKVVELRLPARERLRLLRAEVTRPKWAKYSGLSGHYVDEICEHYFPAFLATVPTLPHYAALAMWDVALDTPARIDQASDEQLLAFKGIGPAVLRKLRARCAEITEGRDEPLLDMVNRS